LPVRSAPSLSPFGRRGGNSDRLESVSTSLRSIEVKPTVIARETLDVIAALPLFVSSPLLRPWHTRWGASKAELRSVMPGDDYFPRAQFQATRAITIDAPPSAVWPWLMQVGYGRAGFYSYDLLDGLGHPSAERILAAFQGVKCGDWVPMSPTVTEATAFKVDSFEPCRWLLWRKPDSTWSWRLEPAGSGTRLVTRLRAVYPWSKPTAAITSVILLEFGDFPMMRRMLKGIRRRAQTNARGAGAA
jgi:hypothetical protein